jgi:hypothetical protein
MSKSFSLTDSLSLNDLHVYLSRASRVEEGSVRLISAAGVLAVYTAILYPRGLLDASPTVLGLRTFALTAPVAPVTVTVPLEVTTVTWAGISPPKGGWTAVGETDAALLQTSADAGIEEVAVVIPTGTGSQIVQRVRSEVWGRPIPGLEIVPSGAAFAAVSLGFLPQNEPVRVFETGPWTRLSTSRGHILVRRKPWSLRA